MQARGQTQEEITRRKQALTARRGSDKENDDEEDEKKDTITQLIENTEKVKLDDFDLLKVCLSAGRLEPVLKMRFVTGVGSW